MNATAARVTIGLPVRNGAAHLAEALDSLLAQTFTDFSLLISDNASTDRTPDISRHYASLDPRISYERLPSNIGPTANFNRVLACAHSPYFMWAAHDDLWSPTYLATLVPVLDQMPGVVLAYSDIILVDPEGVRVIQHYDALPLLSSHPFPTQASEFIKTLDSYHGKANLVYALMRRSALDTSGGFGVWGTGNFGLDLLALLRLLTFGRAFHAPGATFRKRLTGGYDGTGVAEFWKAALAVANAPSLLTPEDRTVLIETIRAGRVSSSTPAPSMSDWWRTAQDYEAESGIIWLRRKPSPEPSLRREFFTSVPPDPSDDALWERFLDHVSTRTVVEVGCGPAPMVGQFPPTATRVAIDPLLPRYRAAGADISNVDCLLSVPAEVAIPEIAPIDGAIICRNVLDHVDDPLALLNIMLHYLTPGAYFVFWTTLWHDGTPDAGHRQITQDATSFRRLITERVTILRDVAIAGATDEVAFGCVGRKQ